MAHTTETRAALSRQHRLAIYAWWKHAILDIGTERLSDATRYFVIQSSGQKVYIPKSTYNRMLTGDSELDAETLQPIVIDRVQKFRDALGHWQYVMLSNTGGGYREWTITEEQFEKLSHGYMYRAFWDTLNHAIVIQPVQAIPKPVEEPEDNRTRINRKKVLGDLA